MSNLNSKSSDWEAANTRNTRYLAYWTGAWLLFMALAAFGPKFLWDFNVALTVGALVLTLGVGAGMIIATIRQVKGLDELHQKIFFEASALALGITLVCGSGYELMEDMRLISFEHKISHLIMLIGLSFAAAVVAGNWRYR